ncbi:DUF2059 domain-containing protein [Lutibacter sp.]|uniref:DUF2059 domain-containing protein n=1 Tax=Lutibacter sp. TaxID=1925666 RepID=UPI0035625CD3
MKKILLIVVACFSLTVNAQQDDQYITDAKNLVKIVSESAFTPMIDQFASMVSADKKEALIADVKATFPELYAKMAEIYMEEFSHSEIKELLAFYATPIGKKLADKTGELSQKGMIAGQSWGMKLQGIIQKYQ